MLVACVRVCVVYDCCARLCTLPHVVYAMLMRVYELCVCLYAFNMYARVYAARVCMASVCLCGYAYVCKVVRWACACMNGTRIV